jgi:hypothetical protein
MFKKIQSVSSAHFYSTSLPDMTRLLKQRAHGFISLQSFGGIWTQNVNIFHLDGIISFSRSSRLLYFPKNSIGPLLVAKIGMVFFRGIHKSVANIFFGLGRWTLCPSKSNRKSLHLINSGDHRKSFKYATSHSSQPWYANPSILSDSRIN